MKRLRPPRWAVARCRSSEPEVQAGILNLLHQLAADETHRFTDPRHGLHGPAPLVPSNLSKDPSGGWQKHLERMDTLSIGGQQHHSQYAAPQTARGIVGAVVADDDRGPALVGFLTDRGSRVDDSNLATPHQSLSRRRWSTPEIPSPDPAQASMRPGNPR